MGENDTPLNKVKAEEDTVDKAIVGLQNNWRQTDVKDLDPNHKMLALFEAASYRPKSDSNRNILNSVAIKNEPQRLLGSDDKPTQSSVVKNRSWSRRYFD